MSKSRLLSGRVKKITGSELDLDRSQFLNLANAEPDLGNPNFDGSILVADIDGNRYWSPSIRADVTGNIFLGSINSADGSSAIRLTNSTIIEGDLTLEGVGDIPNLITSEIRSIDSSSIVIVNSIIAESDLEVQNDLTVNGNFTVLGSTTTINSTTLTVEDKNIELARNSNNAITSDGAGITVLGPDVPASIVYNAQTDTWNFNKTIVGTVEGATGIQDIDDRIDSFFDNDINTTDSSSIVFVPSVEMRSDLTVDNDVRVSNTVYAEKFIGDGSLLTGIISEVSLNDLTDVDTSTVPPTDGQALVYDNASGIWKPGDSAGVTSSITPPVSPNENDLWFNTENLNLYIYYNDGDSVQWVQVNTAGASGTGGGEGGGGGGGGSGVVVYDTVNELPLSNNTAGDQAYVTSTNRLYLWTGNGWFNIALINTNPTITQGPNAAYSLNRDGSPTVITLIAQDPEGIPITWSYQVTAGALGNTATIVQADNVFTITPSTDQADVGTFGVTFVASDGVNIATAISSFRLFFVAADQYYNQSILLTTSTVDGGDNNTFIDSSTNNFTITRNGNTTQGSFSPYGDRWSNYFDGVGDYLTAPANTDFAFGQGDLTVEMWLYPTTGITTPANIGLFYIEQTGGLVVGLSDGKIALGRRTLGYSLITTYIPPVNAWTHILVTRSGATAYIFANGVLVGSVTAAGGNPANNADYVCTTGLPTVAGNYAGGAGFGFFPGYISDLRVVKGTALYTTNFTPPTEPLTAVAGTSLLTCQSNRFKDNSVNNFTLTKSGDVKVTKFSPYDQSAYNASTLGGSAYFDGAGDYLVLPEVASTSGDVTIEFWINPSKIQTYNGDAVIIGNNINGLGTWAISLYAPTNKIGVWLDNYTSLRTLSNATANRESWNHIALVKNAGIIRLYINGIQEYATITQSANFGQGSNVYIGQYHAGGQPYTGYVSNVRVVNGTAIYTSNFTPPTEPLAAVANTSLLCNFTNAGIFDASTKNVLEPVGNAQVDTAVTKFGTGSMYFDGAGDGLIAQSNVNFDFNSDFTIEMWINFTNVTSTWEAIISRAYGILGGWRLYKNDGNNQLSWYSMTTQVVSTTGSTLANNTWSHVAVVRNSGTVTIYIDGINRGSAVNATNYTPGNYALEIGQGVVTSSYPFEGYIDDLRITNGLARYTTNFTPPGLPLNG